MILSSGFHTSKQPDPSLRPEFWVRPAAKTLRVANDGEVNPMETPLHYRIRPRALRVMVPPRDNALVEPATLA